MFAFNRTCQISALALLLLILPQCSQKSAVDPFDEAVRFTEQGDYEKAVASFEKSIALHPGNPRGYFALGGIYNVQNQHLKAIGLFKKALEIDPTFFDAHFGLGFTYEAMGKKTEAEIEYKKYRDMKKRMDGYLEQERKNS